LPGSDNPSAKEFVQLLQISNKWVFCTSFFTPHIILVAFHEKKHSPSPYHRWGGGKHHITQKQRKTPTNMRLRTYWVIVENFLI
jgi:hypothetical protein